MKQRFILAHDTARQRALSAVANAPDGMVVDCRDDEFGGCLFSRGDFEKVRLAIKLAMEG